MEIGTWEKDGRTGAGRGKYLEWLLAAVLALYPLRHIGKGLDFWDTGYSYANFQYMGTEHMDPMWLFSTYLANAAGNLMMRLPGGDTMLGMNFYTGLVVSAMALAGYFFCTRKLGMPRWTAFAGEFMAVSLCWCPTASLYNYLTYLLFLGAFLLLYCGLAMEGAGGKRLRTAGADGAGSGSVGADTGAGLPAAGGRSRRQAWYLVGAGVLLGSNVLVRLPNLAEAAMILAVWAYDVILWMEERGLGGVQGASPSVRRGGLGGVQGASPDVRRGGLGGVQGASPDVRREGFWRRAARHTFWCLLGYVLALALWLGHIHLRYGIGEYMGGIVRLFGMTETASDYKADSMVRLMLMDYVENLYWVVRIGIIAAGGVLLFVLAGWLEGRLERRGAESAALLHRGVRVFWAGVSAGMLCWLYGRKFCSLLFYSYDPIRRPCILFLMLTMLIGVIRIFHRDSPREERLLSGMLILVILLTSIGSNNRTFPSWNNLFVAAPYTLWESWRFMRCKMRGISVRGRSVLLAGRDLLFPVKGVLAAFLGMCLFQSAGFGAVFVFAESTGVQNATAYVENNEVLQHIRMEPQRAQWMTELSAYVDENGLKGREVILYGWIPSLSYYLQMPSAFNPWSDLASYSQEVMEEELSRLEGTAGPGNGPEGIEGAERMTGEEGPAVRKETAGEAQRPVIILENFYALYEEGRAEALGETGYPAEQMENDGKWEMLLRFMERHGYRQDFRNEKFAVYR